MKGEGERRKNLRGETLTSLSSPFLVPLAPARRTLSDTVVYIFKAPTESSLNKGSRAFKIACQEVRNNSNKDRKRSGHNTLSRSLHFFLGH